MLVPSREGKACDAVLKRIEICSGATRSNLWIPEIEQVGPPVDLRVTVGEQEYAFEHTLLQSHSDSISDVATFNTIHKFIRGRTPNPLPGSVHYQLRIPNQVSLPKGRKYREQALNSILEWVVDTAQQLHDRRWEVPWEGTFVNNYIKGKPKYFDQDFELFRWPDGLQTPYTPGVLSMEFSAPEHIEQPLGDAISEAFAKKFPKLNDCKKLGARTVLILEGIGLPVGHHEYIGNVLPDLLAQRTDCPDEIYLVEPYDDRLPWWIWPLKRDEKHWPVAGLPNLGGSYFELGQRPPEEMSEWYRQFHFPLGNSQHMPLEWHPAFFYQADLCDLTQRNVKRPTDSPTP
ncbi:MAG: hypothetical protein F4030_07170 [Gammaproteobacteria bacterium]|nr:hypothetical protein [Gammaproteobacteria bacterium]MYH86544.1 hypothetical protein [Gammaproteobacteria bacterium]MYK04758.1 hypothetical protein [Gammaproteobacteria bacterium]